MRDPAYTRRFGGDAVTDRGRDRHRLPATRWRRSSPICATPPAIPTATYDCIILTQTLHCIDDMPAALRECARILRPGGVLLATAPSVIRVDDEAGPDGDFWRLTEASARKLFADVFPLDAFEVRRYGNVMACAAFLYGMSAEEMAPADLEHRIRTFRS